MATALVTGCSSGIGFATALRLAGEGYDVVATMRNPEADGPRLLEAARAANVELNVRRLDVCDDESVRRAFEDINDLGVLVNNAGIVWFASAEETEIDRWRDLFDTNLFGAVRCMKAALPIFRDRGGGCIVNVSSAAGSVAMPSASAYVASKAALEAASEVVAIEGRPHGLRVVVIETGATETALGGKVVPPSRESPYWPSMRNTMAFLAAQQPRFSQPDDIAEGIARAVKEPTTPFRIALGQGAPQLMGLRLGMSDDEWIDTACGPTRQFVAMIEAAESRLEY